MWTVYGLAIGDVWVYGPNGTGLVLGLIQLMLVLLYPPRPVDATATRRERTLLKDSSSDLECNSDGS